MSAVSSIDGPAGGIAVSARKIVATYPTYADAQRAVDRLSDSGFPVEQTAIEGRDLRLVEQVTGRLTKTRAALMGGASGAWFGLFVGTLLTLFETDPQWVTVVAVAVLIGAIAGAIFGFIAHWATNGQRDFSSVGAVVADRYDITVTDSYADRATQLLSAPA
jgi:hypothetical protein